MSKFSDAPDRHLKLDVCGSVDVLLPMVYWEDMARVGFALTF